MKLHVTDSYGQVSNDTATIGITNVAPTLEVVSGPATGVPGQSRHFLLSSSDPSLADQELNAQTFNVDWGDGTVWNYSSGGGIVGADHTYTTTGTYTIRAAVTDKDGGTSAVTHSIEIKAADLQADDVSNGTVLVVGGTVGDDRIVFSAGSSPGAILVTLNGVPQGEFMPTGRVLAYGQGGNDDIQVAGGITLPAWLYGGPGNDRIKGGGGHNVILGGDGDDLLVGGNDRDLIIGGAGADRIVGNAEDDILIADITAEDTGFLRAVMDTWTRLDMSYLDRIAFLRDNGSSPFCWSGGVQSDGASDVLTGSSGQDWFVLDTTKDRITDLKDEVFTNDLTWIWS